MNIHEGDTVRVVNPLPLHSGLKDRVGRVLFVSKSGQTCSVNLEWDSPEGSAWEKQGSLSSFSFDELEVIKSADEEKQINTIASAIMNAAPGSRWEWQDALNTAADLYRRGVRMGRNDG